MNVILIRFTSGEIVVAEETETGSVINPITAVPHPRNEGEINFVNWIPMGKSGAPVRIEPNNVVYTTEASESLAKNYREMLSPIITPENAGKIIT